MECIMHYASCCYLQGNRAVLHEYKGIYWKFIDDSASFLQISNDFSSWKEKKKKRSPCEKRKHYVRETKEKCFPRPSVPKYISIYFILNFRFYCSQVPSIISLGPPTKLQMAHHTIPRLCTDVSYSNLFC